LREILGAALGNYAKNREGGNKQEMRKEWMVDPLHTLDLTLLVPSFTFLKSARLP